MMRQTLWLLLLSTVLFCFGAWMILAKKEWQKTDDVQNNSYDKADKITAREVVLKQQIYNQLRIALPSYKLKKSGSTLLQDGTLRIQKNIPTKNRLSKSFKLTLSQILPSYFKILSQPHFSRHINKVYIEVHTSSKWKKSKSFEESFKKNKILSNQQARSIEGYMYELPELQYLHRWMEIKLIPVGRSFQDRIYVNEKKDAKRSKRVEIRIEFK